MKTRDTIRAKKRTRTPAVVRPAEAMQKREVKNAQLIALLDSFEDDSPDRQRQELAALQAGIETARPGQRQVFGDGFNP